MSKKKKATQLESKTARASRTTTTTNTPVAATMAAASGSEINRLIPLGGGATVYLLDPVAATTVKLSVASEEFVTRLTELCQLGLAARIERELDALDQKYPTNGWAKAKARLAAAGAFGEAEAA